MRRSPWSITLGLFLLLLGCGPSAQDLGEGPLLVACAANFKTAAEQIGADFFIATGERCAFSFHGTGQIYAQIKNGAPYHVFLAADRDRPGRLVREGLADGLSCFSYARGQLVLVGKKEVPATRSQEFWSELAERRLTMANPKLAPYGRAAEQVLRAKGIFTRLDGNIVLGQNVAQALQFFASGAVDFAFLPLSLVQNRTAKYQILDNDLYEPILQDVVFLPGRGKAKVARQFLAFLAGKETQAYLRVSGYEMVGG